MQTKKLRSSKANRLTRLLRLSSSDLSLETGLNGEDRTLNTPKKNEEKSGGEEDERNDEGEKEDSIRTREPQAWQFMKKIRFSLARRVSGDLQVLQVTYSTEGEGGGKEGGEVSLVV